MSLLQNSNAISAAGGYNITDSLRFRRSASAYLSRTPASAGNRKTYTFSAWIKIGLLPSLASDYYQLFGADAGGGVNDGIWISSNNTIYIYFNGADRKISTPVYRDPSAWYHIVWAVDTTQATGTNRLRVYINGEEVTAWSTNSAPTQNYDSGINNTSEHKIGSRQGDDYFDGYMTEVNFIDGQALDPSYFGETNANGVWSPIAYTGSYGTNGFYLPMKDFGLPISSTSGPGFSTYAGSFDSGLGTNGTQVNLPVNSTNLAIGTNDFTIEGWVYTTKNGRGSLMGIGSVNTSGSLWIGWENDTTSYIRFGPTDIINSGLSLSSSGWVHIAVTRSGSTVRLYKNGSLVNSGTDSTNLNLTDVATVGGYGNLNSTSYTLQGNISNLRVVIGTALYTGSSYTVPTSPLTAISGTQLLVLQDSTLQDNSINNYSMTVFTPYILDNSVNNNDWRARSFNLYTTDSTYDLMSDTPSLADEDTGNFATLNPLSETSNLSTSEANLAVANSTTETQHRLIRATMGMSTGKYYWEVHVNNSAYVDMVGIINSSYNGSDNQTVNASNGFGYGYSTSTGNWYTGTGWTNDGTTPLAFPSSGIIGVAFDADNGKLYFSRNNTWINSANPSAGTGANATYTGSETEFLPALSIYYNTGTWRVNFGQRPFAYTPPTGYKKLNTFNLPDSSITDGSQYFNTVLYTGNGTGQSITGVGFSPDFVWLKSRSLNAIHAVFDTVRGGTKRLRTNDTVAEDTSTALTTFDADGFTLGNDYSANNSGSTFVSWNWRGSDSTAVSNTNGTITSTVSVNTTAGFSIVTYTGNGVNGATVGHGLGVAPSFMVFKRRDAVAGWIIYHTLIGNTQYLDFTTAAATNGGSNTLAWNATSPTSTVFTLGTQTRANANNATNVAYCFAEIAGFSKFGSYTGNGSTDGPFVYTGFRPAWILIKQSSSAGNSWQLLDTSRETINPNDTVLFPNLSNAEGTLNATFDFLSNGFKVRTTDGTVNTNSSTYIYMAFAENPFKNSLAK